MCTYSFIYEKYTLYNTVMDKRFTFCHYQKREILHVCSRNLFNTTLYIQV